MADPVSDWQRALQGKLPEYQAFPQKDEADPGTNFIRWLASGALNIPPAVTAAAAASSRGWFGGGGGAAPEAPQPPAGPSILMTPDLKALGPAQAPGPQTTTLFSVPSPEIPAPPLLPTPPAAPVPGMPDLSAVRQFAEQARPAPMDTASLDTATRAAILGGMAKGAGSVSATEPGSFARALAMWGAGGAGGQQQAAEKRFEATTAHDKAMQQYNLTRSSQELQLAQLKQQAEQNMATVNHQNAMRAYETTVVNQKAQHDHLREKYGIEAPKVTMGSDGRVLIQQRDPTTGQLQVKVHDTDPALRKMEDVKKILDASKIPGGEFLKYRVILDQGLPPEVVDQEMRRSAVEEVVKAGGAATAFGAKFVNENLVQIDKELKAQNIPTNDPTYAELRQKRLIARLLPQAALRDDWIWDAVPFSPGANLMAGFMRSKGLSKSGVQ